MPSLVKKLHQRSRYSFTISFIRLKLQFSENLQLFMNWHCLRRILKQPLLLFCSISSWTIGTGDAGCIQLVGLPSVGISDGNKNTSGREVDLGTFMQGQSSTALFQLKMDMMTLQVSFETVILYWVAD